MSIFDKAKEALKTDKAEELSDKILNKAEQLAEEKLGADKAAHIDSVREKIDDYVGNDKNADK